MKLEGAIARLISAMFHPLVMPTIGILILFQLNTYIRFSIPDSVRRFLLVIIFVNTALAPLLTLVVLRRTRMISCMLLEDRQDRLLPLLFTSLFYIFTYYLLRQFSLPSLIYYYVMGTATLALISLMITFRWKISLHMVSLGGITGFLISTALLLKTDMAWLIMLCFLVSGAVGTSRLILKAHSQEEVYVGYLLGMAVMLILYAYLRV